MMASPGSFENYTGVVLTAVSLSGGTVSVSVEVVLGLAQEMYPAAITQKDKQLVRWVGCGSG